MLIFTLTLLMEDFLRKKEIKKSDQSFSNSLIVIATGDSDPVGVFTCKIPCASARFSTRILVSKDLFEGIKEENRLTEYQEIPIGQMNSNFSDVFLEFF